MRIDDSLAVRARVPADLDECVGVLAAVHARDGYPANWPEQPATWLTPEPFVDAWVAQLGGTIVGHVALSEGSDDDLGPMLLKHRSDARAGVVSRLFVSPDARGYGIGGRLIGRLEGEAGGQGLRPVLDVLGSDRPAIALYERLGWTRLGSVEQQWGSRTVTIHCYAAPDATGEHS